MMFSFCKLLTCPGKENQVEKMNDDGEYFTSDERNQVIQARQGHERYLSKK